MKVKTNVPWVLNMDKADYVSKAARQFHGDWKGGPSDIRWCVGLVISAYILDCWSIGFVRGESQPFYGKYQVADSRPETLLPKSAKTIPSKDDLGSLDSHESSNPQAV